MPTDSITILGLSEPAFRVSAFLLAFVLFSSLEALSPRRARQQSRLGRWFTNTSMLIVATGLVRLLIFIAPLLAISASAAMAQSLGWGFFNWMDLPFWLEVGIAIVLLDLAIWFQHLMSHKIPFLWRIHRVHHADRDLDASSALRFHPVEIALSAAYKLAIVLVLGPPILGAILFEVALNAAAIFNHANLALPRWLDQALRTILVTPDMHRVHHSVHRSEHDTNFGNFLSIWDRVFWTYTAQPKDGHTGMTLGLDNYQVPETSSLGWSLRLPAERL